MNEPNKSLESLSPLNDPNARRNQPAWKPQTIQEKALKSVINLPQNPLNQKSYKYNFLRSRIEQHRRDSVLKAVPFKLEEELPPLEAVLKKDRPRSNNTVNGTWVKNQKLVCQTKKQCNFQYYTRLQNQQQNIVKSLQKELNASVGVLPASQG